LAQTTLSHDEWSGIMARATERFENLWMPNRSDLCFATTNRQAALKAIARRSQAVVVIGSANSSNTRALEKVAIASGCERVLRVNTADELPDDLAGTVGVTAGASAPDELVDAVVARLAPTGGVEEVRVTDEDEYFPPPPELRDLARALASVLTAGLGGPPSGSRRHSSGDTGSAGRIPSGSSRSRTDRSVVAGGRSGAAPDERRAEPDVFRGDRDVSAADVLARLAG
jgi:4-hydroxy-3-methylbut-2-en-1-yl diphosphate reductase